jgi:transcriptional regulator with XRE-family HTH domain
MGKKRVKLSDQIRQAASKYKTSQRRLAVAAGIDPAALCRFVRGERGLMLPSLDALADTLDLHITVGRPKTPRKAGGK